ncbi:hypothetical protein CBS101457_000530 [Exobasidium rhododendri]|nr:hypothetical protein CBS101457_000530 [Exobasidium rhododendri]
MTTKNSTGPRIFVTVGSTRFTDLIVAVFSSPVLDAISKAARSRDEEKAASIMIQFGSTPIEDILLGETLGLQKSDSVTEGVGTLPIKILSGSQPGSALNPTDIAASLSPEAIRDEALNGDRSSNQDRLGFKHFSMDHEASHGIVHLEFIDYVSNIVPQVEMADVVISHAGESKS